MPKPSCGIDFGTTNSALSLAKNDIQIIPLEGQSRTMPTALFFEDDEAQIYFGHAAETAYMSHYEGRFMRSLKRILGTSLMDQSTVVNGKSKSFQDIIAVFLKHLKAQIPKKYDISAVTLGRPVHFQDDNKEADRRAQNQLETIAKNIGFKHIKFQYEPIAAAFAHEQNISGEKLALVVDIGGGTSDFTLIRLGAALKNKPDRRQDILANSGIRIGGNDFDKSLSLATIMPYLGYGSTYSKKRLTVPRAPYHNLSEWSKINFTYTPRIRQDFRDIFRESHAPEDIKQFLNILQKQQGHQLLHITEMAKIDLTKNDSFLLNFKELAQDLHIKLTQTDFNTIIKNNTDKIMIHIESCLKQASIKALEIELIILTGGSTEIPYIQSLLAQKFPKAIFSEEDKLASVALGLGYDAQKWF